MNVDSVVETAKNISEVAPQAYDDILHPPAQNTGTALGTITGLVNTILTPLEILNKTVSLKKDKFLKDYEENLNKVPSEKQCVPQLEIAGPIVEHAKFKITEDTLREKYARLLSAASNIDDLAKPLLSFDNVLNQLSPYEIDLLTLFFKEKTTLYYALASIQITTEDGVRHLYTNIPNISFNNLPITVISVMLSNFERLGLITIDTSRHIPSEKAYSYIFNSQLYLSTKEDCQKEREKTGLHYPECEIQKHCFYLTEFGKSFVATVIV